MEASGLSRFGVADTLFAKITPYIREWEGRFCMVSLPDKLGIGSTEFIVLSPSSCIDPRFVFHLVCSRAVRGRAVARMEGSTGRQRVPEDVFHTRLLVPIPDPQEQAAIARTLDAVDIVFWKGRAWLSIGRPSLTHALLHELLEQGLNSEHSRLGKDTRHIGL